jgi:hypothetical protein
LNFNPNPSETPEKLRRIHSSALLKLYPNLRLKDFRKSSTPKITCRKAVFTNDIFPQPKFHQATPSNGFEKQHSIVANSLMSDAIEGEHVPFLRNTHNF